VSALFSSEFMIRALLAGIGLALAAGPLGCFVVWRRMAYFGGALAHTALLGLALGVVLGFSPIWGVGGICLLIAIGLSLAGGNNNLASDTWLGIIAHGGLAVGLVVVALAQIRAGMLQAFLFGEILAARPSDLMVIYIVSAIVIVVLALLWRPLIAITVHEDLARVEGRPTTMLRTILMVLLALFVAAGIQAVGVLLVTSLLIIPAAAARRLSHSPLQMALVASALGILSVVGGLMVSLEWDVPGGPAIVSCALILFVISQMMPTGIINRRR